MSECQKQRLQAWFDGNNGHPYDNENLYSIVIDTLNSKIDGTVFDEVIGGEKAIECFKRYEDLRECLLYYRKNIQMIDE